MSALLRAAATFSKRADAWRSRPDTEDDLDAACGAVIEIVAEFGLFLRKPAEEPARPKSNLELDMEDII